MREAEIKLALTHQLAIGTSTSSSPFLEEVELNGGEIRADLVHVIDMHCYEIKSASDSLARLVGQGSRYARAFDQVTLVTAECHLKKAIPMLPPWWGIMVVPNEAGQAFKQVRKAKLNKRHEPEVLVTLLKREEALQILEEQGITRGFKSKSLYVIQAKIAELLPLEELKATVRQHLINRARPRAQYCSLST
ncbi:sce7726 family protein [Halopseudomonas aestusnigri]|uniref:sce7726 family protein n=1 Tax=Halopseudomonas aestusnigri TaxID=857252 RepID=UPI0028C19504|nr:sce7726 family protein [Halopseudomonas aestusnigri]